jgi:hypothetical protein
MNIKAVLGVVFPLLMTECTGGRSGYKASVILRSTEKGTDSTSKREYFPNSEKSLYAVSGNYYNVSAKTFIYYHDIDKRKVREIKNYMDGRLYGNYFEFYKTGFIKTYCFYTGKNKNSSRIMRYNESGNLLSEEGTAFVDHIMDGKGNISLYFSDLFCDSLRVKVSTRKSPAENLTLVRSSMQPFLKEANVKDTCDLFFFEITTVREGSHEKKIYNDTLAIR